MADVDRTMHGAPKRATGEIPLSWALPAEAVSEGPPPRSKSRGPVLAAVVVVVVVGAAALLVWRPWASPTTEAPLPASSAVAAPPPAVSPPTPSSPPVVVDAAPMAAAPAEAAVIDPPLPASEPVVSADARAQAQVLVNRARVAARDGDDDKARELAEKAVTLDPDCGGCWRTVAFLRGRGGDRPAAALARARALAVEQREHGGTAASARHTQ